MEEEERRCGGEERRSEGGGRRRGEKWRGEVEERRRGEEKWRRGEVEGEVEERRRKEREKGLAGFKIWNPAQQFCGAWARHAPQNCLFFFFCWKNSSVGHNFFFVSNFENLKKVQPGKPG